MKNRPIRLVYFSPTQTTKKVLESVALGLEVDNAGHFDLTLPDGARQNLPSFSDELVLLGAPVYGGRLPAEAVARFKRIKADNTLAVLVVTYGNREFEDALLELKNLALELGFVPVAGAAFIGEHSFATPELPIAEGRPDGPDLQKAVDFGTRIGKKLSDMQKNAPADLELPGEFPYKSKGVRPMAVSPTTMKETCILCGMCAQVCPTAAVSVDSEVTTRLELCIRCCACIKNCPTGARVMEEGEWKKIAVWLSENCTARKEPEFFGLKA